MIDLGNARRGRGCNVIRILATTGSSTEKEISEQLWITITRTHELIQDLERDGIVFTMMTGANKLIFLSDRGYWLEKMRDSPGFGLNDDSGSSDGGSVNDLPNIDRGHEYPRIDRWMR